MKNNIRYKTLTIIAVSVILAIINVFCNSHSTYASTDFNDPINQKAILEGVVRCYDSSVLTSFANVNDFSEFSNLLVDQAAAGLASNTDWMSSVINRIVNIAPFTINNNSRPAVPFPAGNSSFEFTAMLCNPDLFLGEDNLYNMLMDDPKLEGLGVWTNKPILQKGVTAPPDARVKLLSQLGYSPTGEDKICTYYIYTADVNINNLPLELINDVLMNGFNSLTLSAAAMSTTEAVCYDRTTQQFTVNSTNWSNLRKSDGTNIKVGENGSIFETTSNGFLRVNSPNGGYLEITTDEARSGWNLPSDWQNSLNTPCDLLNDINYGNSGAILGLECYMKKSASTSGLYNLAGIGHWYHDESPYIFDMQIQKTPEKKKITPEGIDLSEEQVIRYLSGDNTMTYSSLAFTPDEQLTYIYKALRYYIFKDKNVDDYQLCDASTLNNGSYTNIGIDLNDGSVNANCGILFNDKHVHMDGSSPRQRFFGFGGDSNPITKDHFGYSIIDKNNITQIIKDLLARGAQVTDTAQNTGNWCLDSGAAGNLGYVLCNVLQLASSATTELYNSAVKPMLRIDPQLFTEPTQTVRQVWGTIRTIANIIFIILFLFVIFSQLTGIGIDNYGIKKALPKIIVAAVLINLSYVICTAFVDLSNILGNGIQDLFNGLATNVGTTGPSGANVGVDVVVGLVALIAAGTFIAAAFMNPAILIGLLVAVLGVLISICFLFILLAMRQGAVVVLTVVSPIAFALYILPNSKKIFDKWLKAGEGMLLLYPICGALVAGGNFISRLLLSSGFADPNNGGSFWAAIAAMAIGIAPIFFIPKVLKSSFAALGNIGAAVSNLGARLRSGATGKIKGSEGYQNLQKVGQRRRTRIKAGLDKEGKLTGVGKLKARFASTGVGKTLYGKTFNDYNKAARKIREEDIEAASNVSAALASADLANKPNKQPVAVYREKLEIAVKKGASSNELYSIIDAAKSAGLKDKDIADITRDIFKDDSLDYMGKNKSNFLREYGNRYAGSFLKKDFQQKAWALSGGMDKYGNKTTLSSHTVEIGDMTDEEVGDLSKKNFERLYNSGAISAVQAGRVYDANKGEDDIMRHMLYMAKTGGTVSVGFSEGEVRGGGDEIEKILKRSATRVVLDNGTRGNTAQNNNSSNNNGSQGNTQPPTPTGDSGDIQLR